MQRTVANTTVPAIGLGCMNVSHAYGTPPSEEDGIALLRHAFDIGVRHFDTAALYGFGKNETLVGKAIKPFRDQIQLASKCGLRGVDGKRTLDCRPDILLQTLDEALQRLGVDHIDLYYMHRIDPNVPVEESVGALARAVEAGKIGAIGLSETSAQNLRKAHATHPIAAVQSEYSLWARNVEIAVLDACRELAVSFVAFSPLARGVFAGCIHSADQFEPGDLRLTMPRFHEPNLTKNLALVEQYKVIANEVGCTMAQLALAWCLSKGENVLALPGTRSKDHLEENMGALKVSLSLDIVDRLDALINQHTVAGPRYNDVAQKDIDTEEF